MKKVRWLSGRLLAVFLAGTLAMGSIGVPVSAAEGTGAAPGIEKEETVAERSADGAVEQASPVETGTDAVEGTAQSDYVDAEADSDTESHDNTTADEPATSFTITLDANGGYFFNEWDDVLGVLLEKTETLNKIIPVGESVTICPVNEQEGVSATFAGWSLEQDGDLVSQGQEEYTPVESCVLYAVWTYEDTLHGDAGYDDAAKQALETEGGEDAAGAETAMPDTLEYGVSDGMEEDAQEGEEGGLSAVDENTSEEEPSGSMLNEPNPPEDGFTGSVDPDTADVEESGTVQEAREEDSPAEEDLNNHADSETVLPVDHVDNAEEGHKDSARTDSSAQEEENSNSPEEHSADPALAAAEDGSSGYKVSFYYDEGESYSAHVAVEKSGYYSINVEDNTSGSVDISLFDSSARLIGSFYIGFEQDDVRTIYLEAGEEYIFSFSESARAAARPYIAGSFVLSPISEAVVDSMFTVDANGVMTGYSGNLVEICIPEGVTKIADSAYRELILSNQYYGSNKGGGNYCTIVFPSSISELSGEKLNFFVDYQADSVKAAAFHVSSENPFFKSIDGIIYSRDGKSLIAAPTFLSNSFSGGALNIPDGVETIEEYAFAQVCCPATIALPDSVRAINEYAFWSSYNLKSIRFGNGLERIEGCAFERSDITELVLPPSLREIGVFAFSECGQLKTVDFGEMNGHVNQSFTGCGKLEKISINGNVDIDSYSFEKCYSLTQFVTGVNNSIWEVVGDCLVRKEDGDRMLVLVPYDAEAAEFIFDDTVAGCYGNPLLFRPALEEITLGKDFSDGDSFHNLHRNIRDIHVSEENSSFIVNNHALYCKWTPPLRSDTCLFLVLYPMARVETTFTVPASISGIEVTDIDGGAFFNRDSDNHRNLQKVLIPKGVEVGSWPVNAFETWCASETPLTISGFNDSNAKYYYDRYKDEDMLKWESRDPKVVKYKVTYNANGGTMKSGTKTVKSIAKSIVKGNALGTLPTPTRSSYCFLGWYTAKSGGSKISNKTKATKTVTYYAHWAVAEIGNTKVTVRNCTWNGKAQQPQVTVTLSGVTLKKGTDYTVTYSNNKEPGKGKAVIKGKGRFAKSKKTKTATFTIAKANQVISPKYASYLYSKNGKKITQKTTVKNGVLTFSSNLKGTKITLNTAVKENAKLTYSSSQKGIPVKDTSKGVFLLSSPTEATITIKAAATKHYKAATKKITIILKADKQTLSLDSPYLTKSGSEYVLNRDVSDELLHAKRGGNVGYTCRIELSGKNNEVWIGKGNLLYAKGEGVFKVRVTTKATSVYPEMTKVFTIRKILKSGLPVNGNNFLYRQIDDNTISLQKYVGSAKDVTIPVSLKIHGKDKNLKQVASSAFLESNVRSVLFSDVSGGKGVRTIGTGAFAYCKGLTTVRLPEGLTTIGNNAFNGCGNLKTVLFANSVNSIGSSAFGDCTSLSGPLFLPLKLKTVGECAFKGCRGITSVMMFPGLTAVDKNAFSGCSGIQDVLFAGPTYRWNNIKFGSGNEPVTGKNRIYLNAGAPVSTYEVLMDIKEKTYKLYIDTPEYLKNEGYERLDKYLEDYLLQIMINHTDNEIVISAIKSIMQGGIIEPSIVAIVDANINDPDTSWAEQDLNKALALELLRDCQDAGSWTTINEDMLSHFEKAHEIAGRFKGLGSGIINDEEKRDLFAELICGEFENLKEEEVRKALKSICDYWKLNEDVIADIESATGQAFDAIEFILTYIEIKEYYREGIEIMKNVLPADTGLYDGVCQLKDLIDKPLNEYIEDLMKKELIESIVNIAKEGLDSVVLKKITLPAKVIGMLINSPTIDEYNRGWISINTTIRLHQALSEMNNSIVGASTEDRKASVRDHTFLAELYFASFQKSFSYVGTTINDSTYIKRIQKRYEGAWNYNAYIRSCLENRAEAQ